MRLFTSPFFRRLFLPYLLLICALVLIMGLLAAHRLRATFLDRTTRRLRDDALLVAELIQNEVAAQQGRELNAQVRSLRELIHSRITVMGEDGTVLADNEADPAQMGNHRFRPEVAAAITHGEGSSIRRSDTVGEEMLYLARRVRDADGRPYLIRLAVHLRELDQQLSALHGGLATTGVVAIALSAVLCYYFARRASTPVLELTTFADAVAHGDLSRRIVRAGTGEMGVLENALNTMAESLSRLLAEVKQDKAELLAVLSSMSDAVVAIDAEHRVLLTNGAAQELLGIEGKAGDGRGKLLWEMVRDELILKGAAEALQDGEKQTFQIGPYRGRHLEVSVCPFPRAATSRGAVVVAHDNTASVRYQELRKEFVANVSHELRTPLTAIKGFAETLRAWALKDPSKAEQYVATIEKHANQLTNLVDDLLELSRLESQVEGVPRTPVDLSAIVRRTVDLLQPLADAKRQELIVRIEPNLPSTMGISDYLERAISNLIDNSIKYTPEGGRISVAAMMRDEFIAVEVTDTGMGIAPEELPRIFERFYRVDRSRSREMGGTGLGLSIVKHVAQAHQGSIEVHSTPRQGSTFTFKLRWR